MRPRGCPRGEPGRVLQLRPQDRASMRPRGCPRGELVPAVHNGPENGASMRPRGCPRGELDADAHLRRPQPALQCGHAVARVENLPVDGEVGYETPCFNAATRLPAWRT